VNPGGRLPVTFYRSTADLPDFRSYDMANRTYRFFKGEPLFPFGHGLSYTTFKYDGFSLSKTSAKAADAVGASLVVRNTGKFDGDEVVQIYARASEPTVPMPSRQLVAFQRVPLKAGESKQVRIEIPMKRLRRWSEERNAYVVDPGPYELEAGHSSASFEGTASIRIAE
jgi:beta-glucosidase